jgi:hypothetical protein
MDALSGEKDFEPPSNRAAVKSITFPSGRQGQKLEKARAGPHKAVGSMRSET